MRVMDRAFKLFELLIVACLAAMVVMVFGNALLRKASDYGLVLFGGGIDISEELSRIMFVWLTFIGAVVVTLAMMLSDALVVLCCAVFLWGTWRQSGLHMSNTAPITGMSMIWVYGVGYFASIGMGALAVARMVRVLTGRLDPEELREFAGEYDADPAHSLKSHIE
jgi:TRAP-type C4-dicarboxylate transport system permease small subunit